MELHGSKTTFNVENVLRQNIINSDYFRDTCLKKISWEEVVDEIYYHVEHVEPWMSGNARGASTAFCLLYRLFTLKLNMRQVKDLLDHPDSPYIRAIGFLYLRYVGDPKTLWGWYEPYLTDDQEISPSPGGPVVTVSDFVLDIMLCQYYFETIFPRIPKKAMDAVVEKLKQRGLRTEAKGNGGAGGADRRGVDEPNRRPASVKASLSVAFGQRAPNRSNAREDGRARDPMLWAADSRRDLSKDEHKRRSRSRSRSPERFRHRSGRRESREHPRGRERERERERAFERRRSRSFDRPRRPRRSRSRSRSPNRRSRRHKPGHRSRSRDRRRPSRSPRDRRRRDRSDSPGQRDRRGGAGRDVRDVFKESAPGAPSSANQLKMVYGS